MKLYLILISFLLSLSGLAATFNQVRIYQYSLFETEEKCKNFQETTGRWFNCFQHIEFRPDGTATLMYSDIANRAIYDLDKNTILIQSQGPGDMAPEMQFKLSPNKRAIVEPTTYKVWELQKITIQEEN